jgi:1-acyl-sn-glycerol-3-phosphate acyltransferase
MCGGPLSCVYARAMERPPRAGLVFRFVARVVITIVQLLRWRIEVRGLENVPRQGGVLVTFNHHSYADFVICAWSIYRDLGRPFRFLAKEELFHKPVLGWILRAARQVPVSRGSRTGRKEAFAHAVEALKSGEVIIVAPEQTISESFELLPFTPGTARMAQESGVPIVPHVNWGTQRWATKGRPINWRARRIPILAYYGEPMTVGPEDEIAEATARLRTRMAELLDKIQHDYPEVPAPGDDWWLPRRLGGGAPDHEEVLRRHEERHEQWRRGEGSSFE